MIEARINALRIAYLLQAVLSFATVAGFALAATPDRKWLAYVLGALVVLAQISYYLLSRRSRVIQFKNDTCPKFAAFFSEWYSRSGDHVVFCKDLDWMDQTAVAQVSATLREKKQRATVIVSRDNSRACAALREGGVAVIVVPEDIVTIQVKMSLFVKDEQFKEIIVQKKPRDSNQVKFVRTTDSVMIALAETVIAACKNHQSNLPVEQKGSDPSLNKD